MDTALKVHMPGPVCLIENAKGQLRPNQKALEILSAITQPVVVVAIVGLYRTGKSYLMNKLAGKNTGFSLGSTVQAHTKGIWMWCVPHPHKKDHTLVLLDTEGLGDVEKGDNQNDCWIFALAVLLSSTFVYNSMGAINQQAMDQLHYVTELTDRIRARASPDQEDEGEDSAEFVSFFPDFVWSLRDMTLKMEIDGVHVTADEYLENSLKLKEGICKEAEKYNLPRLCIRKFFPKKKCFIFYPPTEWKKLSQLETLQENEIESDFLKQVEEFCLYIFNHCKAKTLPGGIPVNGPRLESLVLTYVEAICSGDLPCMENAVLALATIENAAAVQKATAHYDQQMSQRVQLPTETLQELLDQHRTCEREAIEIFLRTAFKDEDHSFQKELGSQLEERWDDFCKRNLEASSNHCWALLQDIFRPLEEGVRQGIYSKPGGYFLFVQETQRLKKKYYGEPKKGIQAEEVLQTYIQSKEAVSNAILQTDQSLTKKEKEIEVERKKTESAMAAAKLMEETQKKNEKLMEQKEKSYQEHMRQLTQKMENDRIQLKAEQERTLALKLQEQKQLLQEGFREESRKLQEEIKNVEKRYKEKMDHMQAESSKTTAKIMEEMQRKYDQMMENKDKNHQEHVRQLIEEMERDRAQQIAEQEKMMTRMLQEQEQHLKEEISEKRRKHQKEIQEMEAKNRELLLKLESAQAQSSEARQVFQEMEEMNLKIMGQKEKAFEDYVKQLTEKMDADTARLMAKQEEILTKKLQEQEEIFNKKLRKQNKNYEDEIRNIKMKKKNSPCSVM
ncbi:guanylate-binding protein 1-like isoform X1 [Peromyscus maniculatus bairdii]|uniref:guanylate-binding protein 1-like isoform X1 n=1 Tax=Peromyscus maniculatus bairdii TaxID=230844 RepID=UPI00042AA3AB|nr:guanylate-binding protein 1-like isoform X1 [Peromyscus maniculatus bairdii]XP_042135970.1 guanylate-binding protein 1-like isoform X1 [Peromyscus maniculatus bairdii]